jgi:hypothetical protein
MPRDRVAMKISGAGMKCLVSIERWREGDAESATGGRISC